MQKILLAINANNPNKNALEFACYLGRLTRSKVTGVFLENLLAVESPKLKKVHEIENTVVEANEKYGAQEIKSALIEKNISLFKEACICRGVNYVLHRDRGLPSVDLIKESRFADVLVADAATSFNSRYEGSPSAFTNYLLKRAECPVIIAPDGFEAIDEIIFTYDGSASSVFAIKQFTYLFPQFYDKKACVVQVNETGEWHDPDKYKFKEWLKGHYMNLHFEALKGEPVVKLFDYIFKRKNIFFVMGAYGRSALSQFFSHSHADLLIKTTTQPIFIAHL